MIVPDNEVKKLPWANAAPAAASERTTARRSRTPLDLIGMLLEKAASA
jgi:hypothetical protein